jgi:hypothetical protein
MTQQEFLTDLIVRRGQITPGYNPEWFLELTGASILMPTAFEPDPNTHRDEFYYNASLNNLYQKVTNISSDNIPVSIWKRISN